MPHDSTRQPIEQPPSVAHSLDAARGTFPVVVEPPMLAHANHINHTKHAEHTSKDNTHPATTRTCSVSAIVVTWNRKHVAETVLREIAKQNYASDRLDVVLIDNGSTDGTADHLVEAFAPETIVDNPTEHAHEPSFQSTRTHTTNTLGVRSFTVIKNTHNHGGCGGFNTGLRYVGRFHADPSREHPVDYAWLVDDDVELPTESLSQLVTTAERFPAVGLVGSRAVNMHDRTTTIETTVYFDFATGRMTDTPPAGHPLEASHKEWIATIGGPKGDRAFAGQREVDIASACSLLARWRDVREIGFWDPRFFIYCDDADWCLRFKRAGRKVLCDLDAVVYHTPWFDKLTPTRLYYAQRNAMWVTRKAFKGMRLKRAIAVWSIMLLKDAAYAIAGRRLFHACIIMRTLRDAATNHGGKLEHSGPKPQPLIEALIELLQTHKRIACMCSRQQDVTLAEKIHNGVRAAGANPTWIEVVRNDVPECDLPREDTTRVAYARRLVSKLRRQMPLLVRKPDAVIVFDQVNDMPLLRGKHNIHVDSRTPDVAQIERGGAVQIFRAVLTWFATACVALWHAITVTNDRDDRTRAQTSQSS